MVSREIDSHILIDKANKTEMGDNMKNIDLKHWHFARLINSIILIRACYLIPGKS